jgi:hypothetical protein
MASHGKLTIELAAARSDVVSVGRLLDRINDGSSCWPTLTGWQMNGSVAEPAHPRCPEKMTKRCGQRRDQMMRRPAPAQVMAARVDESFENPTLMRQASVSARSDPAIVAPSFHRVDVAFTKPPCLIGCLAILRA